MKKTTTILLVTLSLFSLRTNAQSTSEKMIDSSNAISKKDGFKAKKHGGKMTEEEREMYKKTMQEKAANMTPEERIDFRAAMKKKFNEMSPAEKKEMRSTLKKKFDNMTPEEQQKLKEQIKNKRDSTGNNGPRRIRRKL